jgi:hypothetical protein
MRVFFLQPRLLLKIFNDLVRVVHTNSLEMIINVKKFRFKQLNVSHQ